MIAAAMNRRYHEGDCIALALWLRLSGKPSASGDFYEGISRERRAIGTSNPIRT